MTPPNNNNDDDDDDDDSNSKKVLCPTHVHDGLTSVKHISNHAVGQNQQNKVICTREASI